MCPRVSALDKKPDIPMSLIHVNAPVSVGASTESPLHGFFEFSHRSPGAHKPVTWQGKTRSQFLLRVQEPENFVLNKLNFWDCRESRGGNSAGDLVRIVGEP